MVQDDWGVGVIRKGKQEIDEKLNISLAEMDWDFFLKNQHRINYISGTEFLEMMDS